MLKEVNTCFPGCCIKSLLSPIKFSQVGCNGFEGGAFTVGQNVFGPGQFSPGLSTGKRLLAHNKHTWGNKIIAVPVLFLSLKLKSNEKCPLLAPIELGLKSQIII